jgi:spore coat protein U-like protein
MDKLNVIFKLTAACSVFLANVAFASVDSTTMDISVTFGTSGPCTVTTTAPSFNGPLAIDALASAGLDFDNSGSITITCPAGTDVPTLDLCLGGSIGHGDNERELTANGVAHQIDFLLMDGPWGTGTSIGDSGCESVLPGYQPSYSSASRLNSATQVGVEEKSFTVHGYLGHQFGNVPQGIYEAVIPITIIM